MIDEDKIIDEFSSLEIIEDNNGLIPMFGVNLTRNFGDYYSAISYKFEMALKDISSPEVQNIAQKLLIESGHVCGFNTLGGVMKSEEWKAIVKPMIENKEDWIKGVIPILNLFGWGSFELLEISEDKLIVNIDNSFEANYYLKNYDVAESGKCYLEIGAIVSLMSLVYEGNIENYPELNEEYYDKLFKHQKLYSGKETLCKAKGDDFCQIEVTKNQ